MYVDDVLLVGTHEAHILQAKLFLHYTFTIKDLGYDKYFLGIEIAQNPHETYLNQRKYILDILFYVGLSGANSFTMPLPTGLKLTADYGTSLGDPAIFRRLVSRLVYLNFTRPGITYGMQLLSQFVGSPRQPNWEATLHLLRYLKGSPSTGLFFSYFQFSSA